MQLSSVTDVVEVYVVSVVVEVEVDVVVVYPKKRACRGLADIIRSEEDASNEGDSSSRFVNSRWCSLAR